MRLHARSFAHHRVHSFIQVVRRPLTRVPAFLGASVLRGASVVLSVSAFLSASVLLVVPTAAAFAFTLGVVPDTPAANDGGTLLVHAETVLEYTSDNDYCTLGGLTECGSAATRVDENGPVVAHILAAFYPDSGSHLKGIVFGIDYGPTLAVDAWRMCGDFELAEDDWPSPGSGNAVVWFETQTDPLVEVGWLAPYSADGSPGRIELIPHPTQGAYFADDSTPALLDPIAGLGSLGFYTEGSLACPEPPGLCCFEDGSCQLLRQGPCEDANGAWQEGISCDPNPCPQPPVGACCFDDGSCTVSTQSQCDHAFGMYQGDETICEPNPCPQPHGACCFTTGVCEDLGPNECDSAGGNYQGNDTLCEPNPCPQPTEGACCLSLGSCEYIPESTCEIQGGEFLGLGILCAPNPCVQPCEPFALAGRPSTARPTPTVDPFTGTARSKAATRSAGSRVDPSEPTSLEASANTENRLGPNGGGTLVLHLGPDVAYSQDGLRADCDLGGEVQDCQDIVARTDQESPVLIFAIALFPSESAPRLLGLTFGIDFPDCVQLEDWESCGDFEIADANWPSPGTGTAMTWSTAQTDQAVAVYQFFASGLAAEPGELALAPHPTQGAVFADDSIPSLLDEIAGLGSFGFFRDGITPCPQAQEPIGACCFENGTCRVLTIPECDSAGGEFLGAYVYCAPNPCPQPIVGACCFTDGTCLVRTESQCASNGGNYQGDDTSCSPNPCPQPTGACCIGETCVVLTRAECTASGGTYRGDYRPCDPNPCVEQPGACCLAYGNCIFVTRSECAAQGGFFLHEGTPCYPNPCPTGGGGCPSLLSIEERVARRSQVLEAAEHASVPCAAETGRGSGTVTTREGDATTQCGELAFSADGTYENGYAWQYGGVVAPYYGAFAEGYENALRLVCAIILDLTQVGNDAGQTMDLYVWEGAGGQPGAVLGVRTGADPSTIAFWPSLSRHEFGINANCADGGLFAGYWGNWPNAVMGWFVGADLDGYGGCPLTNIAPGIGYPTGWNNVSIVWGPTQAIGIGVELNPCGAVPIQETSWGKVKALFR